MVAISPGPAAGFSRPLSSGRWKPDFPRRNKPPHARYCASWRFSANSALASRPRLHFRLCVDQLGALLSDRIGRASASLDWADGAAVAELLGPSLAYHRTLAGIGGGVHAGLLLSRTLHLTRLQMRRQLQEWIGSSTDVWTEQIGLTRREQEIARRELVGVGVWEETLVGIPAATTRPNPAGLPARAAGGG
jgi:hypothetical protein